MSVFSQLLAGGITFGPMPSQRDFALCELFAAMGRFLGDAAREQKAKGRR